MTRVGRPRQRTTIARDPSVASGSRVPACGCAENARGVYALTQRVTGTIISPAVETANDPARPGAAAALLEATRLVAASAEGDLDAVLDAVAEQARRLLGADAAALGLTDPTTGDLIVRRPNPLAPPGTRLATPGKRYRPGAFTQEAVRLGTPLFAADVQRGPRRDPARRAAVGAVVASMVVPLLATPADGRPELVGTLYLDWTRPYTAGPADLAVAEAFGQQAAVAIRIARALEAERAARQASEAALRAAVAEQARLDGAITTARAVAHLINNELVMLVGYAEILPRLSPTQAGAAIRSLAKAADALAGLVDRLQRIVRFEETDPGGVPTPDLTAAAPDDRPAST
ncbi:MAG TPA: GAF domain-containing protein [Chloroflexota bacterium]|nr:GAF domain-containing protein [Chloroflexota bacterium]